MTLAVKNILDSLFARKQSWEIDLARQWTAIVGTLHTRICLEKIDRDTIIVGVYDPHWMQELYLLSPMLISSINKNLGGAYVRSVHFRLAASQKTAKKTAGVVKKMRNCAFPAKRTLAECHQKALVAIKDPELQKELVRLFDYCQQ